MTASQAFRIRGLVAGYGAQDHVLKGVDLDIREGRLTVLVGPNGAGKSTLLKTLAGLLRPIAGSILLHEQRIDGLAPRAVARAGVSYVPQEHNVFDSMPVRENLEVAAWLDRGKWRTRAEALFQRFPLLAQRAGQAPRTFSGGQRQVLAMAMGLMSDPRVLLLDEPSAGLSPVAAQQLFDDIAAIRDQGRTIVMVEQHADEALRIADDGCVLVDGKVARHGPASDIAADPEIRRLFLGG